MEIGLEKHARLEFLLARIYLLIPSNKNDLLLETEKVFTKNSILKVLQEAKNNKVVDVSARIELLRR